MSTLPTPEGRAAIRRLLDRQTAAQRYPTGTWAQRWLPGVCKHDDVRCTHGDEIIARGFRRRLCMTCGRALRGPMPSTCWFTGALHGLEHP